MKKDDTWKTLEDGATCQAKEKSKKVKSTRKDQEDLTWKAINRAQVSHSFIIISLALFSCDWRVVLF